MQTVAKFSELIPQYDAFLCDLWGVIHDGEQLYPGVLETLEAVHAAGKPLMFLSNAPRLAESVAVKMDKMGVKREWYCGALTSGEAAHRYLRDMPKYAVAENAFLNGSYFYQGFESDAALLEGLPQRRVESAEQADFILCGNFDSFFQPYAEVEPRLKTAAAKGLPMLCINPDLEVVRIDGSHVQCSGWLAARYEEMGGRVGYIGKPYPLVYEMALEALTAVATPLPSGKKQGEGRLRSPRPRKLPLPNPLPEGRGDYQRILMIGDNLHTDIQGGITAGLDTALVTQGVLKDADIEEACSEAGILPDYVLSNFR